jgi:hypothetical protein
MKNLLNFFFCLLFVGYLKAQNTPWIRQPEQAEFSQKLDSILETRFNKPMELFEVFDAGAQNFARCEAELGGCSEEYVYNEAYLHEMSTLPSPVDEFSVANLIFLAGDVGSSSVFEPYMKLLDPDKYWVGYYEIEGKYLLVVCLGVDREKTYAEMGIDFGKQ